MSRPRHGCRSAKPVAGSTTRLAVQSTSSVIITSITCHVRTPALTQPVTVFSWRPQAICICRLGLPSGPGKTVPTPATSCAWLKLVCIGTTGWARSSAGPTISRLPSSAPPRTISEAAVIDCAWANASITSCSTSPSSRRITNTRPCFASEYFMGDSVRREAGE